MEKDDCVEGTLKPKEMQKVASYIVSLKSSNPADAKAPEGGEIWVELGLKPNKHIEDQFYFSVIRSL